MERTPFEWCKEEKPNQAKTISTEIAWKKTRNDKITKKAIEKFQNSLQWPTIEWRAMYEVNKVFSYGSLEFGFHPQAPLVLQLKFPPTGLDGKLVRPQEGTIPIQGQLPRKASFPRGASFQLRSAPRRRLAPRDGQLPRMDSSHIWTTPVI